jgi:hypothetical protein
VQDRYLEAPLAPGAFAHALEQANTVVFRSRCQAAVDVRRLTSVDFKHMTQAGDVEFWIRVRHHPPVAPERSP